MIFRSPSSVKRWWLGLLGGSDVVATLYVVTQQTSAPRLVRLVRQAMTHGDVLAGVSELPNGCGASARLLGPTSKPVRAALANAWNATRLALLGALRRTDGRDEREDVPLRLGAGASGWDTVVLASSW